ncbi:MAG: 50S ribosomal protein L25 [Spirochaetes bacterium]|nr:50S ribosomal protein L25 [Spirochaetota bacterium]MBU0955125.1 50S ribosomal protein L25 [Spirochaetota bacterium]
MTNQPVLNAQGRTLTTKGALNELRRNGKIPAVMYNRHGTSTVITIDGDEFRKVTKGVSESTIIKLLVDGKEAECFIKDRQIDWLHSKLLHIDFFQVERGVAIRVKVPVHVFGSSIGVREGGILENPVHELEVECMPKDVPERFEIDISDLKANHSIHVRDLKLAEGVKVLNASEQVIVLVKYAKGEAAAAEAAAEPAAE